MGLIFAVITIVVLGIVIILGALIFFAFGNALPTGLVTGAQVSTLNSIVAIGSQSLQLLEVLLIVAAVSFKATRNRNYHSGHTWFSGPSGLTSRGSDSSTWQQKIRNTLPFTKLVGAMSRRSSGFAGTSTKSIGNLGRLG